MCKPSNENIYTDELVADILESITDAFFSLDQNWNFTYINNEAEKLLSRKRSELIGKNIWDEFPKSINSDIHKQYNKVIAEHKTVVFEEFFPSLNRWFSIRIFPARAGLSAYFHDISDKKLIEKEKERLLEREKQDKVKAELERNYLNNFLMQTPAIVGILKGANHIFELSNPFFEQLVGHRNLIGKSFREALPELEGQGFYELLDNVYKSGEAFTGKEIEATFDRTGNNNLQAGFFNLVYQPMKNLSGKIDGIIIFAYEVTNLVQARKKAEKLAEDLKAQKEILQENNEWFRLLSEAIPQIVWTADNKGLINYYNRAWYEYTGKTFEETKDNGWDKVIHINDLSEGREVWGNALEKNEAFEFKCRFRRNSDNTYRWHLCRGLPMKNETGEIIRWFGTCTDIDQQERSSQSQKFLADANTLLNSSLDYETILENIARLAVPEFADWASVDMVRNNEIVRLGVAHQDPSKVELANELFIRFPPKLDDPSPSGLPHVIRTGISELVEYLPDSVIQESNLDDDIKELFLNLGLNSYMVVPLKVNGKVIGGISFVNEKSNRIYTKYDLEIAETLARNASLAIHNAFLYKKTREMEESFRLLAEAIPQQVWTALPDGTLDYVNKRVCEYFNLTVEEMIGQGWQNVIHPDDLQNTLNQWSIAISNGTDYETEFRLINALKNEYRWHIGRAIAMKNEDNEVIKWFGTNTDIHEIKEYEERLARKSLELENSNNELKNFAYIASHDLQEPLRTMSSYASLIKRRNKDIFDEDSREFIEIIIEASKRMKTLIEDLLEYSQVDKQELKEVNLNRVFESLLFNLKTSISENNVTINCENLPVVRAVTSQMLQLFQNIISNSIKYRSSKDPIININVKEEMSEWIFSISDNGIGIEEKYFDKIFVMFQRLHQKNEYKGTGIGLATCKKIIDIHYGKIWLKSKLGEGTTFYISIPK